MKLSQGAAISLLTGLALSVVPVASLFAPPRMIPKHSWRTTTSTTTTTAAAATTKIEEDCGCATEFSGNPSKTAQSKNIRESMRGIPFYTVDGRRTEMDDVLKPKGTSVVVFLRSLG
mmetsp:Transcript_27824/g.42113  ORF Transcript_27824/g.42113 Transcript_27824/m.42113 type:complete len:117 (+) Transcript_27824:129-479(+)